MNLFIYFIGVLLIWIIYLVITALSNKDQKFIYDNSQRDEFVGLFLICVFWPLALPVGVFLLLLVFLCSGIGELFKTINEKTINFIRNSFNKSKK